MAVARVIAILYVCYFYTQSVTGDSSVLTLQGVSNSHIGYAPLSICPNSQLTMMFKSYLPDGLLLYMDRADNSYMEIKLVGEALRMRLNIPNQNVLKLSIGENLNDGRWHKLTVSWSQKNTQLKLDNSFQTDTLDLTNYVSTETSSSLLYVGGLPDLHVLKLKNLSLPTVYYEPRFSGSIANISYINCSANPELVQPDLVSYDGLRNSDQDLCATENPCQNKGRCLSTNSGTICNCENTGYSGVNCSTEYELTTATLSGSEYLYYNFTGMSDPVVSKNETIRLAFKTNSGEALIFHTGKGGRYLNIGLQDAVVYIALEMGSGEKFVYLGRGRQFDDNLWHTISVKRKVKEYAGAQGTCQLHASVDGSYETSTSFAGYFKDIPSSLLFVGGMPTDVRLPGARNSKNFVGCLKGVQYEADSMTLDVLKLGKTGSGLISQTGDIIYDKCEEVGQTEPIAKHSPSDVILLRKFASSSTNFLSVVFHTSEEAGLLVYASGRGSSVFALEIYDGYLYLILNHTGVLVRELIGEEKVNNNFEQKVMITLKNWGATINLNGIPKTIKVGNQTSKPLRFTSPVSIAGIDSDRTETTLHPAVYTAGLQQGFVGCLNDLKINGVSQNLKLLAREQKVAVSDRCSQSEGSCKNNPCKNDGICEEGWGRVTCHCEQTAYTGSHCNQESVIMRFDGKNHFTVTPRTKIVSIADDISLHFRTRHSHGSLLRTRSKEGRTGIEVFLHFGKLFIQITLGDEQHSIQAGEGLNDYQWYALTLRRRGRKVRVILNSERVSESEIPKPVGSENLLDEAIQMDEINIGLPLDAPRNVFTRDVEAGQLTNSKPFIGHIRQFIFNEIHYSELAFYDELEEISHTSVFSSAPVVPNSPVSIGSEDTYVEYDLPHTTFHSLYLQLKTSNPSGLLLYRKSRNGDYIALEIIQGVISYLYSIGGKTGVIEGVQSEGLNDNKWHDVVIMRLNGGNYYLIVDDVKYANSESIEDRQFQLNSALYIAGVPTNMYGRLPSAVRAPFGFVGCLASMDINGVQPDLISNGKGNKNKLVHGCFDSEKCQPDSCKNSGVCVERWPTVSCDCNLTSFTGAACGDDGMTYRFGRLSGGLVIYTFPFPRPDSVQDRLAFGIMTKAETRATLIKLTSFNSADLLEISITDGIVKVMYNVGVKTRSLVDSRHRVNDGKYHVIKFTRSGSNATLQIDLHPKIPVNPKISTREARQSEDKLSVFNSMDKLYVGSDLTSKGAIHHPFDGLISGLIFNTIAVLEYAESNHPVITIQGDAAIADLDDSELKPKMQSGQPFGTGNMFPDTDDIILPSGEQLPSPCSNTGMDPDFCNEDSGSIELISTKIVVTEKVSARVTKPPPPFDWTEKRVDPPGDVTITDKTVTPIRLESTTNHERVTHLGNIETQSLSTADGPFDLQKNLPLIAGICGAALVTAILIGVIIYRLTRKQQETYSSPPHHRPSCSVDDDLRLNMSGCRVDSSTPDASLHANSLSRRTDGKEWYV